MKRFLFFYNDVYYPNGGMEDYIGNADTLDEAVKLLKEHNKKEDNGNWSDVWCHIYDTEKQKIIWQSFDDL